MIPFPYSRLLLKRRPAAGGGSVTYNAFQASPVPGGSTSGTLSNSNRRWTTNTSGGVNGNYYTPVGSVPAGKKAYWELQVATLSAAGVGYVQCNIGSAYIWYVYGGTRQVVGTTTTSVSAGTNGMVLQFAVDDAAGKAWFGRDGTWINTGSGTPDPAAGTGPAWTFTPGSAPVIRIEGRTGSVAQVVDCNFGHAAWTHSAPSGFSSINV